jgi:hypothetical protein
LDPRLRVRLAELQDEGQELWNRFDIEVRQREWGSAMGVNTILADLLGYEAYGIEIDPGLVATARALAARFDSRAVFAVGSFLPAGYTWRSASGDSRLGTIGQAPSAYYELGHALDDFDVVFGYPWSGEEPIMHDVMRRYGRRGARLLMHGAAGVQIWIDGRLQTVG